MNMIEKRRRMRGQGGFTLIELLVVIAILAVLAGVVVFAVNGINNNSQQVACDTEKRTIDTAIQAYFAQNTAYPTADNQWIGGAGGAVTDVELLADLPSGYTIAYGATNQDAPTVNAVAPC